MAREVSSKILDGINDLVIMAPIREGFINAYETVTYATRLRIIAGALNDIRVTAREYETLSPFSDASERILSLLDFKAGIIDNDMLQVGPALDLKARRYFYLIATFDGVWEPYMRLIWKPLGSLLDLLFANCDGYVFAEDNCYADYIEWVRSAQVDSAVFFATTGVTVQDQLYLRRLERLHRDRDPALLDTDGVSGDLALTRMALVNPAIDAQEVRKANPVIADRLALEALGVFYRLADYYPALDPRFLPKGARSEGYLLQRAVHRILEGWDYQRLLDLLNLPDDPDHPMAGQKAAIERFRVLILWFETGISALPSQAQQPKDPVLQRSEVQRGILPRRSDGAAKLRHGALLLMTVSDHAQAAAFVDKLLRDGELSFEADATAPTDGFSRTIGFTKNGLQRLAISRATVDAFPKEFREGLHLRAPQLGDVWDNHPRNWRLPDRNWPVGLAGSRPSPPVEMEEVDLVLSLRHHSEHSNGGQVVEADIARLAALGAAHGVFLQAVERLENHFDDAGHFRDHFNLRDNFSQPRPIVGDHDGGSPDVSAQRDAVKLGELLCGYANDRGDFAPADEEQMIATSENPNIAAKAEDRQRARALQFNGSYLVIRKMSQNVRAFERFKADNRKAMGGDEKALVGKLVGRHPDGQSLVDPAARDFNDFDYTGDDKGILCPFAAHIRRSNPRAVDHGRPSPRLLRSGMTYGPRYDAALPDSAVQPRGLMFMAYNASISEQYETIQRWLNGGNSTGVASGNNDPLTGTAPRPDSKRSYRFEADGRVVRVAIDEPFVRLEWGLYLFVPSRSALSTIAEPGRRYYEIDEPLENKGRAFLKRVSDLPADLAAAEWQRVIEDFDSKDITQRDITPNVYSAIRYWQGGSEPVAGGIDKHVFGGGGGTETGEALQPAVIAASSKHILAILRDDQRYSVETQLSRLVDTSGPIYVAEQPDNVYDDPSLHSDYWGESIETNEIIDRYDYADGYAHGYAAGKTVLDWLIADASARNRAMLDPGHPEFKMELRREYISPALARLNHHWFGLPDGGFVEDGAAIQSAQFMEPGDWDWAPADNRLPLCPGDCLSPSRHAFYPRSNPVSAALAKDHGAAIKEAGRRFAAKYFDADDFASVPGIISRQIFALPNMTEELAAQNVIGIMLGATPPILGNLHGILYDWLHDQTFWRHQAALHRAAEGERADYDAAKRALLHPLSIAMCKRPSPELLYRTCKGDAHGKAVRFDRRIRMSRHETREADLWVEKGTTMFLPLVSATQRAISKNAKSPGALATGVTLIFGGKRGDHDAPVHACPGRKLAMGAMLGVVAALLDVGRIQSQPAGLIVKVSDWA